MNEHFVFIGDKLAKSIQPSNEQSSTVYIQPDTVKFRFKPISVLQVIIVIKNLQIAKLQEFMVSLPKYSKNVLGT